MNKERERDRAWPHTNVCLASCKHLKISHTHTYIFFKRGKKKGLWAVTSLGRLTREPASLDVNPAAAESCSQSVMLRFATSSVVRGYSHPDGPRQRNRSQVPNACFCIQVCASLRRQPHLGGRVRSGRSSFSGWWRRSEQIPGNLQTECGPGTLPGAYSWFSQVANLQPKMPFSVS